MARTQPVDAPKAEAFDADVPAGGYAWWYLDAISANEDYGLTMIAFIGSVFSPYYAWSGRTEPLNHCAINIALYGRDRTRWAMTERGSADITRTSHSFQVGPSALNWDGDTLVIDINERGMPLPLRVTGQIRVRPKTINQEDFTLDAAGRHTWQPIAPAADVDVAFSAPDLSWSGDGYLDHNRGSEALEDGFRYWDWSRAQLEDGHTAVLYNTDPRTSDPRTLALMFNPDGSVRSFDPPPEHEVSPTRVFRIRRRTRAEPGAPPRIIRTLEDTPFYSRSIIETRLFGQRAAAFHESFDGDRLRSPVVKLMLPFRMPRLARGR